MGVKHSMGVPKAPSKAVKKPSKLDNIKTFVFGGSKKGSPKQGSSSSKKTPPVRPSTAAPKAPAKAKTTRPATEKVSKGKPAPLGRGAKKASVNTLHPFINSSGETVCREVACEGLATSGGYCRLHYIKNWKKIKRKEGILREKKLNQYIEELVLKYPDKYIEAIRQDLASDKDFAKVIYDLDLDESVDDFDAENAESADSLIDTIKRDFEDDGDAF